MTDSELLALTEKDAQAGMEQIARQFSGYVYAIVKDKLSAFSDEDIEETVQDIFVRLWQNRNKIDLSKGSLKAYICVLAKSVSLRRREQLARAQRVIPLELISDFTADGFSVDNELTKKELIARLRALPDDDRQLIMRRFYLGQAYKDIAASLGISEAAARKRCERLLKKLAEQIEEVS